MSGSGHEVILISLQTMKETKNKLQLFSLWTEIRIEDVPNKKQGRYTLHHDDRHRMLATVNERSLNTSKGSKWE